MTSSRRLSSAYLAQVFSVGGSAALTLLSTWLLSPDERGQLAIVMLWFTLGSYIGSLGLPSQMLKFGAERNASEAIAFLFPAAMLSTVTLAILGSCAALLATFHILPNYLLVVGVVGAAIGAVFNLLAWYDYGQGNFFRSTSMRGAIPLFSFFVLAVDWAVGGPAPVLLTACAYSLLTLVFVFALFRRTVYGHRSHGRSEVGFGARLSSSVRYFSAQALALLWLRTPVLLAAMTGGAAETAVVSLAMSVVEVQSFLPQMKAAMIFRDEARASHPRLRRNQISRLLSFVVPGAVCAVCLAVFMQLTLPAAYDSLVLLVLVAIPGTAALAVLGSILNIVTVQGRAGSATLVLAGTLSIVYLASLTALVRFDDSVRGMTAWSLVACVTILVLGVQASRTAVQRVRV
jgi:O-antigen/teichoic acid export membrane protein